MNNRSAYDVIHHDISNCREKLLQHLYRLCSRLVKVLALLRKPLWRRALLHGVAATTEHRSLVKLIVPKTVIDVGANKGQFTIFAIEAWPKVSVVAIEPLGTPAAQFRNLLAGREGVRLIECAIGATTGSFSMHVSSRADSSSLLPIGKLQSELFPGTKEVATINVPVRRLSDVLSPAELATPILLKIDVQGGELEVLKGSEDLLRVIRWLYVECSEVELYRGQPLRAEVELFLRRHGFAAVSKSNPVHHASHGLIQSDLLFARPDEWAGESQDGAGLSGSIEGRSLAH